MQNHEPEDDLSPPTEERAKQKQAREREKIRARRDQRATYDLPPELRRKVKVLAEDQRIPASQLVTLALLRFLKAFEAGEIPMGRYKQPSRSPRYDWNLVFPTELSSVMRSKGRGGRNKPEEK